MNKKDEFYNNIDRLLYSDIVFTDDVNDFEDLNFSKKLEDLYPIEENKKDEVYYKLKNKNNKRNKVLKVAALAAAFIVALPFTNYGQGVITTIKELALPSGRIQVVQDRINIDESLIDKTLPDSLQGKVFDSQGNTITVFSEVEMYNSNGDVISGFGLDESSGEWIINLEKDRLAYEDYNSLDTFVKKLSFNPLILKGDYNYKKGESFSEEGEKSQYGHFHYTDSKGRDLILFERVSSPETAYTTGSEGNIEEVEIDGVEIIYIENHSFEFERDGLLIGLQCTGANYEELKAIYKDLNLYH